MRRLEVKEATLPEVLENLRTGAWQVPRFQRNFVWNEAQILAFLDSIFQARPIGMVTLWAQADDSALPLEPISVLDWNHDLGKTAPKYIADLDTRPNSYFAILDGQQRCTALAMVFSGLCPSSGIYRFAGQFFFNVAETDPTRRVIFRKHRQVADEGLDHFPTCVAKGILPLAANFDEDDGLFGQWMNYVLAVREPANYPGHELPDAEELVRREQLLRNAYTGLSSVRLAVYIVSSSYDLDQICDIFETLNTTGTKVSTVDLIHSTLYAETYSDPDGGINLREGIGELSQLDGATGWADPSNRPELVAQLVTAVYVALESKPPPRQKAGYTKQNITSVKSGDLLATPAAHWRHIFQNQDLFARYLGEFQECTADGLYPARACPYPISSSIYVALRWYWSFESGDKPWGMDELGALYCAFFWRNALTNRYDQGFLTQLGTDLKFLKSLLNARGEYSSALEWARASESQLESHMEVSAPTHAMLRELLLQGRHTGALQKALTLPLVARTKRDLLAPDKVIAFPDADDAELHHIFPKSWCRNNVSGELLAVLDGGKSDYNYPESVANLIPLSRASNRQWRAKVPGQAIIDHSLSYEHLSDLLDSAFIDRDAFDLLTSTTPQPKAFWERRADLMTEYLAKRCSIRL